MAKTNQINVKVNDRTNEAIEEFKDDRDFNKAEAVRRMTESRLVSEGYLEGVAVSDGGSVIDEIETNRTAVQQTQNELENTQSAVGELSSDLQNFAVVIIVALLWSEFNSFLPEWLLVASGILLFVAVVVVGGQVIPNEQ